MEITSIECINFRDYIIKRFNKYQKIEQIFNNAKDSDGAVKYNWLYKQIKKVLDGNAN